MLPPDVEPIDRRPFRSWGRHGEHGIFTDETSGSVPEIDGAGVALALWAAIGGCIVGLVAGLLIGWGTL